MILDDSFIKYKDENGKLWYVGELAKIEMERGKTYSSNLHTRDRTKCEEYKVLFRVALFLGLIKECTNDKLRLSRNTRVVVSTGLPEDFVSLDSKNVINQFSGSHSFQIQLGNRNWVSISAQIDESDVIVRGQAFGTVMSMLKDISGRTINKELLRKPFLVYDGGHFTTDTWHNKGVGVMGKNLTEDRGAMLNIIRSVINKVETETQKATSFREFEFDKLITSDNPGKIRYGRTNQVYDFTSDLMSAIKEIEDDTVDFLRTNYNDLNDISVLIVTGGIGKLFFERLESEFASENLMVILAENNEDNGLGEFSSVFANVVGFFKILVSELSREMKNKEEVSSTAAAAVEE